MPTETSRFGVSGSAGLSPDSSGDLTLPDGTPLPVGMIYKPGEGPARTIYAGAIRTLVEDFDWSTEASIDASMAAILEVAAAMERWIATQRALIAGTAPTSPPVRDDGGPAFPWSRISVDGQNVGVAACNGMSLRDWLAGQAVSGAMVDRPPEAFFNPARCAELARAAYGLADALLAARKGGAS